MKKNKHNNILLLTGILLAIGCVAAGLFIPSAIMEKNTSDFMDVVYTTPEEYYLASESAMARNASEQLSFSDRMKLISGEWDSKMEECDVTEGFLTQSDAIALAKDKMEFFHDSGIYPYSIASTYDNWYSWSAKLYRYTDTSFNTYTTYLWVITFTKYNNSLSHTIVMTENGCILNAEVNENLEIKSNIYNVYTNSNMSVIFGEDKITLLKNTYQDPEKCTPKILTPDYDYSQANIDFYNIYNLQITSLGGNVENYLIYQYNSDSSYGIGITTIN